MIYGLIALHLVAIMYIGGVAQDRAMARGRRAHEHAILTGDFTALETWMRREHPLVYTRVAIAIALAVAMGLLVWAGVYP